MCVSVAYQNLVHVVVVGLAGGISLERKASDFVEYIEEEKNVLPFSMRDIGGLEATAKRN